MNIDNDEPKILQIRVLKSDRTVTAYDDIPVLDDGIFDSIEEAFEAGLTAKACNLIEAYLTVHLAAQRQALRDEVLAKLIDWPDHCDKGFEDCIQCHNRWQRNTQLYEARAAISTIFEGKE